MRGRKMRKLERVMNVRVKEGKIGRGADGCTSKIKE
jgi:hypothetical protein